MKSVNSVKEYGSLCYFFPALANAQINPEDIQNNSDTEGIPENEI